MKEFLTQGLYTIGEVSRLLSEETRTVRRWAFGYRRRGQEHPAVINTDVPAMDSARVITFLEVIELLSIQGFLSAGISWAKVRDAATVAVRLLREEQHPFARREWFVDPAGLYLKLGHEHDEDVLVEVAGDAQVAMEEALRPYLHQIHFGQDGLASQWYPLGPDEPVVLDPRRSLGAPIIAVGGVRTAVILDHHLAGDSVETISSYFAIAEHEVLSAIRFESDRAA